MGGQSVFLLQLVLWSVVFLVARQLLAFRRSVFLNKGLRAALADFGPILAIIVASGMQVFLQYHCPPA